MNIKVDVICAYTLMVEFDLSSVWWSFRNL